MPKVSVILPSLNVKQYINECVESVLNQTLSDIEIICIDAGSTDGTLEEIQMYAAKDKRIKVIISKQRSYGHQMNLGIKAATGEYIGIVETDDYIPAHMYEELYDIAKKNDVDFIKADFNRFIYEDQHLTTFYNKLSENPNHYHKVLNPVNDLSLFSLIMNTWSGIYNTEFIIKYNIKHNETPGASFQDTGFWFQTFCLADRVYFVNKPYYMNRRDNPNSSVHNKNKIYAPCDEFDFIYSFLERNPKIKEKFIGIYGYYCYKNYMASYNRSAEELRQEFLVRFQQDFIKLQKKGELIREAFPQSSWNHLKLIIENPQEVYKKDIERNKRLQQIPKTDQKKNLQKKIYGFYYCLIDHGFIYTLKLAVRKLFIGGK